MRISMTTVGIYSNADPDYARQVDALLDAAGHRGPGETELANSVYADVPWLLLRAVAGATDFARVTQPTKPSTCSAGC